MGREGGKAVQERLKERRLALGMTQQIVAQRLGITRQAYQNYESGARQVDSATLRKLSRAFYCSADYLLGDGGDGGEQVGARVPILGTVRAGYNRFAQEERLGYALAEVARAEDYFFLNVTGDSMEPQIHEGDLALIHKQDSVESGELAVVLIGEDEATVKRVIVTEAGVMLQPFNSEYDPMLVGEGEYKIVGKVVRTTHRWE